MIQIRGIERARIEENVNENVNLENNNDREDDDTRIMRLRFEEVLHTLTETMIENIEERKGLMNLKKGVPKDEVDRANRI